MSSMRPTTWFSGRSAPEDRRGPSLALMFGIAFLLYSPLGVLVILACFVAFNYYRVSHRVLAAIAAIYGVPYLLAVTLFSSLAAEVRRYHAPVGDLFHAIRTNQMDGYLSSHWAGWLAAQLGLSLLMGLGLGAMWMSWKWLRRPAWEDNDRIPGPLHRLRRRRVTEEISSDRNGPIDGATLGVDDFGERIVQTHAEAAAHTLLAGGSGSGKTTTMMIGIRDAMRRGEPVCVIDLKGATDLPAQVAEWAQRYGRRFLHWSITDRRIGYTGPADGPAYYDPIGRGDPSRKKDLLVGSEKWDVEYYKSVNENYLQIAFQIAALVPNTQVDAFTDLASLLDIDKLKQRAAALFVNAPKTPEGQQHAAAHGLSSRWWEMYPTIIDPYVIDILNAAADTIMKPEESERSAIRNMAARVQKLRQSTAGAWLKRDPEHGRDIDLRKVADHGWVVVFSLDSSNYEATSAQVGGLIIQDLKTLSSELRVSPAPHPFHVYVDEFSAIGSDNILGMLARARDAKMPCMLSTQALADLKKANPAFLEQALGIVNAFIIHRANTDDDAEIFAGLTGKKMVYTRRYNVEMTSGLPGAIGTGAATGQGMIEQREDFVVTPSAFQALKTGQLVYIAKSPTNRVVHPVHVIREDPALVAQAVAAGEAAIPAPTYHPTPVEPTFAIDDDETFPSPWPVMAPETGSSEAATSPAAPKPDDGAYVPTPLHEVTQDIARPRPATSIGAVDLSEWEESPPPTPSPLTPSPARTVRQLDRPEPDTPVIDPTLFLGDADFARQTTPTQQTDPPAAQPLPHAQPSRSPLTPQQTGPTPDLSVPGEALPTRPAPPSALSDLSQPSQVGPAEGADDSVFAGGSIDWEEAAPDWGDEDLSTPPRTRRQPSGNRHNLPTTSRPTHRPVMRAEEWNE